MWRKHEKIELSEINQSWKDIVAIQFSGWMGIPTLASSLLILQKNSFLGSILTIIVGSAIMWFIRFGMIAMSSQNRQSTLDISKTFLGNFGGYFISILLLVSTFAWYIAQTSIGGNTLTHLISIHESPKINQFSQVSVFLGVLSTLFCMEGIGLLRKLSLTSFPILIISFFLILFNIPKFDLNINIENISLSGISLFLATNLSISSDLPTFFRHSQSWREAIIALTAIQIINMLFGILGLFLGILVNGLDVNEQYVLLSGNYLLRYSLIVFIFISVLCANVANVYSSSVGWEILAPSPLVGRKEYLIMGLGLTILFILFANLLPIDFLLTITDFMLVNLCIILCVGYIISIKFDTLPNPYLQKTYFLSWFLSSSLNIFLYFYKYSISPLIADLLVIALIISIALTATKIKMIIKKK